MSIRLVATDLDGTLLNEAKEITPKTMEVIHKLKEQGIYFGLASGRPIDSMLKSLKDWKIESYVDYLIGSNGNSFYDMKTKERSSFFSISGKMAQEILDFFEGYPVIGNVVTDVYRYTEDMSERNILDAKKYGEIPVKVNMCEFLKEHDPNKVLFVFEPELLDQVDKRAKEFKNEQISSYSSAINLYEFMHKDMNKGYALHKAASHFQLTIDETMAFGDAMNDAALIQQAGIGVCMSNGYDSLKKLADDVTDYTNEEDGLAKYLEKHVLGEEHE